MKVNVAVIFERGIEFGSSVIGWEDVEDRFVEALKQLTDNDALNLSRRLSLSIATIRNWKYNNVIPMDGAHMFATIEWVEGGKEVSWQRAETDHLLPWL